MKILHVAQSLKGGPASYFDEIIPHQVKTYGAENISLVIPADDLEYLSAGTLAAHVYTFPTRQRSIRSLAQFAMRTAQVQQHVRPDIVHFHSTYAGAIGRLINVPRIRRPAIVYCAHGWAFERSDGKTSFGRSAIVITERLLATITDRIVNLSESDQRQTTHLRIAPGRTTVIENAIAPLPLNTRGKEAGRKQLGLRSDVTNILFVGRLDRQKGFDLALEVMRELAGKPFHLLLIGQNVTDGKQANLQLPGNVTHIPWIPRSEVIKYYEASDLLLMPSRWEGLPITLLEAMRAGLPTLASSRSSLPYVIDDDLTGRILTTFSARAFAEVLSNTSIEDWRRYGLAARRKFEQRYSSEVLCSALDEMYGTLANQRQQAKAPAVLP